MLKLFKRKKVDINSISFPVPDWAISTNNNAIKQWANPEQTIALSINFFDLPPDLPNMDIEKLRSFYRDQVSNHKGGLVEVEMLNLQGYNAIRTIFKISQEPFGMTYLASITIPFNNCSFVIKIQAPEVGTTGMRDNIIAMKLLQEGKINISDNGYEGWFNDPYDATIKEGVLKNLSEQRKYDNDFPQHPLSKTRTLLDKIEANIQFGEELKQVDKFSK